MKTFRGNLRSENIDHISDSNKEYFLPSDTSASDFDNANNNNFWSLLCTPITIMFLNYLFGIAYDIALDEDDTMNIVSEEEEMNIVL